VPGAADAAPPRTSACAEDGAGVERALLLAPEPDACRFAPELVSAHLPTGTVLRASQATTLEEVYTAAREGVRSGCGLLVAAGSDALFRAVAGCALGERGVRVAYLPTAPEGLLARVLGAEGPEQALSRLGQREARVVHAARVNGRPMLLCARLGRLTASWSGRTEDTRTAELLLDGLRLDARLGAISVALVQEQTCRGLAVTLHRARVDPRVHTRGLAGYGPTLLARHPDGSATWQLRVRRFTARLASPLGLSVDGGPPAPRHERGGELTSVLYAEHLPESLCLVGTT
jgi:hypothetical protein